MAEFDEDALKKYFQNMGIEKQNQQTEHEAMQGMGAVANPPPNPYAGTEQKKSGGWTSIVSPIMKIGGMAATALGQPEIGIPLSIAGGAVGGAGGGGGITGALGGGLKSGVGQAVSYGMGSKGYDVPGGDGGLFNTAGGAASGGGYTVPAKAAGGSMFGGS